MPDDAPQDPRDEFFASIDVETKKVLPDDPAVPSSAGADSQSRKLLACDMIGSDSRQPIEFSYKAPAPIGSDGIGGLLPFVVLIVIVSPLVSFISISVRVRRAVHRGDLDSLHNTWIRTVSRSRRAAADLRAHT